jgi:hypothetical protein
MGHGEIKFTGYLPEERRKASLIVMKKIMREISVER